MFPIDKGHSSGYIKTMRKVVSIITLGQQQQQQSQQDLLGRCTI
jgi:hypothetical protein